MIMIIKTEIVSTQGIALSVAKHHALCFLHLKFFNPQNGTVLSASLFYKWGAWGSQDDSPLWFFCLCAPETWSSVSLSQHSRENFPHTLLSLLSLLSRSLPLCGLITLPSLTSVRHTKSCFLLKLAHISTQRIITIYLMSGNLKQRRRADYIYTIYIHRWHKWYVSLSLEVRYHVWFAFVYLVPCSGAQDWAALRLSASVYWRNTYEILHNDYGECIHNIHYRVCTFHIYTEHRLELRK